MKIIFNKHVSPRLKNTWICLFVQYMKIVAFIDRSGWSICPLVVENTIWNQYEIKKTPKIFSKWVRYMFFRDGPHTSVWLRIWSRYRGNISRRFSSNSEASASEFYPTINDCIQFFIKILVFKKIKGLGILATIFFIQVKLCLHG